MVCGAPRSRSSAGPVGREHDERHPRVRRLDDRRPELHRRGPGRDQHDDRPAIGPGHAQREEARRRARRAARGPGGPPFARSASASGVDRDPGHTTASRTPAATSSATNARSSAASLTRFVRRDAQRRHDHGAELDPRLLPLGGPGRSRRRCRSPRTAWPGCGRRSRSAGRRTARRRRRRPSQPIGPAYQPRSKPSCSSTSASATSRGSPPTAGVGCRSPATDNRPRRLGQRARDLGRQVLDEPERHDRGLGRDLERLGDRRQLGRGSRPRRWPAPRDPSRRRAGRRPGPRPRRRRRRGGSSPATAIVRNERPSVRASRSGVEPRNVRPSRRNAKVVLSGALAASRRRAFATSSSTGERSPTRRASTTLSIRPRPTAPANMPTRRSQASCDGCSASIASGANTGLATMPFGLGSSSRARRSSAAHRRSRSSRRRRPPTP